MKGKVFFFLLLATASFTPLMAEGPASEVSPARLDLSSVFWGDLEKGLRLGVSQDPGETRTNHLKDISISIENLTKGDLVLNLGIMLGNGRKQYPTALYLVLTSPNGVSTKLDNLGPPGISGRLDLFIVPLPGAAIYTLRCNLGQFHPAAAGSYKLAVGFKEDQLTEKESKGMLQEFSFMPYWVGTVQSGQIEITVP